MEFPLLNSLFDDEEEARPQSISELNAEVRSMLESRFSNVWVEGEIVNFSAARSGHWYFSLHDADSQIRAACYRGANSRIRFQPFDGLQVRVRGRLTIYGPKGDYQILIESLEPIGEGALRVAYEQIKTKLDAEGLFAHELKRPLPPFPRTVGVVTSPTGAAFFDILQVLSRRARSVNVVLIPTRVQGETAGEEICAAIRAANEHSLSGERPIDVLIVGRGGGSAEDLWAFNEEPLARAIRGSSIPVISAVGHEIDFTIADLVSDLRAPTPSAAAEIVAQKEEDILDYLDQRLEDLGQIMGYAVLAAGSDLQSLELSPVFVEFPAKVRELARRVDDLSEKAGDAAINRIERYEDRLASVLAGLSPMRLGARVNAAKTRYAVLTERNLAAVNALVASKTKGTMTCMAKLDALSPLNVLGRGYSITENADGKVLRSAGETTVGDKLKIRLASGKLEAEVLSADDN